MKKKLNLNLSLNLNLNLSLSLFLCLILFSCGDVKPKGDIKLNKISVADFNQLVLEGKFRAFYIPSDSNFVEVETYQNLFENLDIHTSDKVLSIKENRPTSFVDFYNVTIYSKQAPQQISISDSVEMNVSSEIKVPIFKLNLKNNGKFIGAIKAEKSEIEMQDTSLANFKGFTKKATLKIKDTAGIISPYWFVDAMNLEAENGTYSEFSVKDTLAGKVNNTAKLLYYGNPIRTLKIEKSASVNNKELE